MSTITFEQLKTTLFKTQQSKVNAKALAILKLLKHKNWFYQTPMGKPITEYQILQAMAKAPKDIVAAIVAATTAGNNELINFIRPVDAKIKKIQFMLVNGKITPVSPLAGGAVKFIEVKYGFTTQYARIRGETFEISLKGLGKLAQGNLDIKSFETYTEALSIKQV